MARQQDRECAGAGGGSQKGRGEGEENVRNVVNVINKCGHVRLG
jgi:hypothetical protein